MTLAAGKLRRKIVNLNGCPESKRELNYCVFYSTAVGARTAFRTKKKKGLMVSN
jgi:hypothetical protein